MPIYDKTTLRRKAQELGFNRDSYEKMSRLTEILGFMGSNNETNPMLALKGHSCCFRHFKSSDTFIKVFYIIYQVPHPIEI